MFFFFSSKRRLTKCALVTGVQTFALPIFGADPEDHVPAEIHDQLSLRERAAQPALPWRARLAALSQRRGALHRLQAVRGGLPAAGDHHRIRAARRRQPPDDALRYRHDEMHLLRAERSEEHTSELQSLMRISYAVICLKKIKN